MSASYTPAPWHCDGDAGYGELNGYRIRASEAPEYIIAVAIGDVPELSAAAEANARLIAAAPDLVEALLPFAVLAKDGADDPGINMNDPISKWITIGQIQDARDALSKALGEGEGM